MGIEHAKLKNVTYNNYIYNICLTLIMFAQVLLRFGLAFVFLWNGVDKLLYQDIWLAKLPDFFAVYGNAAVYGLGVAELLIGFLVLSVLYRIGAFIAVFDLVIMVIISGISSSAVYPVAMIFMALALALHQEEVSKESLIDLLQGKREHKPRKK